MLRPRLRAPATPEDIWGPSGGSIPAPVPRTAFGGTVPVGGQHPCGTLRRPYGPPSAGQFHPLRVTLFPRLRSGTRRTCVCAAVVHRLPVGQGQPCEASFAKEPTRFSEAQRNRESEGAGMNASPWFAFLFRVNLGDRQSATGTESGHADR